MNKLNIYNLEGKEVGSASLPVEFSSEPNRKLLAQAMHIYRDRQHPTTGYAKTRAEVDITKKKIYRQKGTGGARHGASSAHIFVGGGVAHGPKGVKRELVLPQAMRRKAMKVAMSMKASDGKVVVVSDLGNLNKTREFKSVLSQFGRDGKQRLTVVLKDDNKIAIRALRNISNVVVTPKRLLNAYDIFLGGIIILDGALIEEKLAKKSTTKKAQTRKVAKK